EPVPSPPAPPRPRRRKWKVIGFVALSLLVLALGGYVYLFTLGDRRLREAVAEADRLDPGWRLEELEAKRATLPAEQNSALRVLAVKKLMPRTWPTKWEKFFPLFQELPPQAQLNEQQITVLREELAKVAGALPEARKLADLPQGRYPITYSPDFTSTRSLVQEARDAANILAYDAMRQAQGGDVAGPLASCRAVLNAARSVGDEPSAISQLVRIACREQALQTAERTLAQGQPSEAALAALQRLLEQEEAEPLLLIAARGERAGMDRLMQAIRAGQVQAATLLQGVTMEGTPRTTLGD